MRTALRRLVAPLLLVAVAPAAHALDVPLPGTRLLMKTTAPRFVFRSVTTPITIPTVGGSDDPLDVGATLTVMNPTSGESFTFNLPAGHWMVGREGRRFRFADKNQIDTNGMRTGLFKSIDKAVVKFRGETPGITLDEASQGSLWVIVESGTLRYCAFFGGDVVKDEPGEFRAVKSPAPSACPAASPSGAFLDAPGVP